MTLGTVGATAVIGMVAILVVSWGARLSVGSSRHGPGWAHGELARWRLMPWLVALAGAGAVLALEPIWVGVGVMYIAAVTGWLMRSVRRRLELVRDAYGGFDVTHEENGVSPPLGGFLLMGGGVLAGLSLLDLSVRGWSGIYGLILAVCLGIVGFHLRRMA